MSQTVRSGIDGRVVDRARLQMPRQQCQEVPKRELEMQVPGELRCPISLQVSSAYLLQVSTFCEINSGAGKIAHRLNWVRAWLSL